MNCVEARKYLELFLDGELDIGSNLEVLRHLELCADCGALFEGERQVLDALRSRGAVETAPEELRRKIRASLAREASPRAGRRALLLASMIGATLTVGLVARILSPSTALDPAAIAEQAVRHHESARSGGVQDDAVAMPTEEQDLTRFFESQGERTCAHDYRRIGYRPKAGSIERRGIGGNVTCWTILQSPVGPVVASHASFRAADIRFDERSIRRLPNGVSMMRLESRGRPVLLFWAKGFV